MLTEVVSYSPLLERLCTPLPELNALMSELDFFSFCSLPGSEWKAPSTSFFSDLK